jgi:C2 domain-containing protein
MGSSATPPLRTFGLLAALVFGSITGCGGSEMKMNETPGQANRCATQCAGAQVCADGMCADAFPRLYTITIEQAMLGQRNAQGNCWDDPGCGAPDPVVKVFVNSQKVGETHTHSDTYQATFNESFDVYLSVTDKLQVLLYDADLIADEVAAGCVFAPITADRLRLGNLDCMDHDNMISASIAVRPGVPM